MLQTNASIFFELLSNSYSKSYMYLPDLEVNDFMFWNRGLLFNKL